MKIINLLFITTIIFLGSCKKDIVSKKLDKPNLIVNSDYKRVVNLYAGENGQGYVKLTIVSENFNYLNKYCQKFENANINLIQINNTDEPRLSEEKFDTLGYVKLHFDWTNFNFDLEKGKLYNLQISQANSERELILTHTFTNVSEISSSGAGFAAINIYNTYQKPWTCFCNQDVLTSIWRTKHSSNYFYNKAMDRYDNLEIRSFSKNYSGSVPADYYSLYINQQGNTVYGRPRFNYSSSGLPTDYTDVNTIIEAKGCAYPNGFIGVTPATLKLYIAG